MVNFTINPKPSSSEISIGLFRAKTSTNWAVLKKRDLTNCHAPGVTHARVMLKHNSKSPVNLNKEVLGCTPVLSSL